jgi:hypothetical protein
MFTSIDHLVSFVLILAARIAAEEGDPSVPEFYVGFDSGVLDGICHVMNLITGTDVDSRELVQAARDEFAAQVAELASDLENPGIFDDNDQGW